jgi:hypothetical protein
MPVEMSVVWSSARSATGLAITAALLVKSVNYIKEYHGRGKFVAERPVTIAAVINPTSQKEAVA